MILVKPLNLTVNNKGFTAGQLNTLPSFNRGKIVVNWSHKLNKMKSIVLSALAVLITAFSFGQVTEGYVKFDIEMSSDDPAMQSQMAMFEGSNMEMYFSPDFGRVEFAMGMLMNMKTVTNNKSEEGLILMSGMVGNKAIRLEKGDLDKAEEERPEVTVEATNETKKILGYTCKKYILSTEEGVVVNYWTSDQIKAQTSGNQYMNDQVSGFPMQFESEASGLKMTFTATEFKDNLKGYKAKELFSMEIPEGYEEMSTEDLKAMGM